MSSKNLAIQTALSGDWQSATSINQNLLTQNPNDTEALNRLAFAFTILGKIKEAKATYKRVLDIDPLNPIAARNLKKLAENKDNLKINSHSGFSMHVHNTFLEETGKTKIVELINIAQPRIISNLRIGQPLNIYIKRLKIFVENLEKQYIGVLPDDIGNRLISLIKGGNQYEALIRSADNHHVIVFLKEIKRATRFSNQPSFLQNSEKPTIFYKKGTNTKNGQSSKSE
ncbi:MAG: hypothetical protein ACD_50C00190G0002 [uncultured bacterium]|nr:MAG: hypothetical protein ACD_50C00190G0002 [uncultured bacterium]OGH14105.1 MAG: hypothetical protein A2687_02460 [Candidatus Levybacteria bacterium RIFCSPHIGHO2_01_FULL_38_26]